MYVGHRRARLFSTDPQLITRFATFDQELPLPRTGRSHVGYFSIPGCLFMVGNDLRDMRQRFLSAAHTHLSQQRATRSPGLTLYICRGSLQSTALSGGIVVRLHPLPWEEHFMCHHVVFLKAACHNLNIRLRQPQSALS